MYFSVMSTDAGRHLRSPRFNLEVPERHNAQVKSYSPRHEAILNCEYLNNGGMGICLGLRWLVLTG